jgi:prepilin-type N-terminal cleavage/methylation domain-containing protein
MINFTPKSRHGFTLIELLVVMSIISLLSSVVLATLNTARLKALDAKVIAQLVNVGKQAEIFQLLTGGYGTIFTTSQPGALTCADPLSVFGSMFTTAAANGGLKELIDNTKLVTNGTISCGAGISGGGSVTDSWAVSVLLPSADPYSPFKTFCIKTGGKIVTSLPGHYYPLGLSTGQNAGCYLFQYPTTVPCGGGPAWTENPAMCP